VSLADGEVAESVAIRPLLEADLPALLTVHDPFWRATAFGGDRLLALRSGMMQAGIVVQETVVGALWLAPFTSAVPCPDLHYMVHSPIAEDPGYGRLLRAYADGAFLTLPIRKMYVRFFGAIRNEVLENMRGSVEATLTDTVFFAGAYQDEHIVAMRRSAPFGQTG
jgi:hypothetical protein